MYSNKEVGSLFSLCEWGLGIWLWILGQLWVSNNREGTETMARDVDEGSKGVTSGLGHDNATCLSAAV